MRVFVLAILISFTQAVAAQQYAFELWHDGRIILETGDTLKGRVKYDLQNDLLQYEVNNRFESYTARKVLFFEIFDATIKNYRQFYSLPYSTGGSYKAPIFFELLAEGKITLLTRERLEFRTYNSGFYYNNTYTRMVLVNKFYLLKDNGNIEEFLGNKAAWLDMMGNRGEDVGKFAKSNRLDFEKSQDLGKIISYYNSLFSKK